MLLGSRIQTLTLQCVCVFMYRDSDQGDVLHTYLQLGLVTFHLACVCRKELVTHLGIEGASGLGWLCTKRKEPILSFTSRSSSLCLCVYLSVFMKTVLACFLPVLDNSLNRVSCWMAGCLAFCCLLLTLEYLARQRGE